jgi:predicted HTH transcriptional regulator
VQKKMLALMSEKPAITIEMLSNELGINKRNVEKNIKALKEAKLLVREGARRNGHWKVRR